MHPTTLRTTYFNWKQVNFVTAFLPINIYIFEHHVKRAVFLLPPRFFLLRSVLEMIEACVGLSQLTTQCDWLQTWKCVSAFRKFNLLLCEIRSGFHNNWIEKLLIFLCQKVFFLVWFCFVYQISCASSLFNHQPFNFDFVPGNFLCINLCHRASNMTKQSNITSF